MFKEAEIFTVILTVLDMKFPVFVMIETFPM